MSDLPEDDIPEEFFDSDIDMPFQRCRVCSKNLLDSDEEYFVEKAIRNHAEFNTQDIIFEIAVCMECSSRMNQKISGESKEAIEKFYLESVDIQRRHKEMISYRNGEKTALFKSCFITGENQQDLDEYHLVGVFKGGKMIVNAGYPQMIGFEALSRMSGLLSKKTKDEMGGFYDDHLGPSPEIAELLEGRPSLIF